MDKHDMFLLHLYDILEAARCPLYIFDSILKLLKDQRRDLSTDSNRWSHRTFVKHVMKVCPTPVPHQMIPVSLESNVLHNMNYH